MGRVVVDRSRDGERRETRYMQVISVASGKHVEGSYVMIIGFRGEEGVEFISISPSDATLLLKALSKAKTVSPECFTDE